MEENLEKCKQKFQSLVSLAVIGSSQVICSFLNQSRVERPHFLSWEWISVFHWSRQRVSCICLKLRVGEEWAFKKTRNLLTRKRAMCLLFWNNLAWRSNANAWIPPGTIYSRFHPQTTSFFKKSCFMPKIYLPLAVIHDPSSALDCALELCEGSSTRSFFSYSISHVVIPISNLIDFKILSPS